MIAPITRRDIIAHQSVCRGPARCKSAKAP